MNQFEQEILKIFLKAPQDFYSPCGRQFLTFSEIETRRCLGNGSIRITDKEIVFRKFLEINRLEECDRIKGVEIVYAFFKDASINKEHAKELLLILRNEIATLLDSPRRILHNPF